MTGQAKWFILAMISCMVMSSTVFAKALYLKNNEEIDCDSFVVKGQTVDVRINRDTNIQIPANEIDLKKTEGKSEKLTGIQTASVPTMIQKTVDPPVALRNGGRLAENDQTTNAASSSIPNKQSMAKQASQALRAAMKVAVPSKKSITNMISSGKFQEFEKLSRFYENRFAKDPIYEERLNNLNVL